MATDTKGRRLRRTFTEEFKAGAVCPGRPKSIVRRRLARVGVADRTGQQCLQRHVTLEVDVVGAVNHPHATFADAFGVA